MDGAESEDEMSVSKKMGRERGEERGTADMFQMEELSMACLGSGGGSACVNKSLY